jgi:D-glycero-D-manno-heptose 1,7-bisphosphate phosphatase
MAMHRSALFLDRDGVTNVDHGHVHRPDQFEFVPGIFELARYWTNEMRRPIVVVTNQSGIGRGHFDESAYADLTRWMCDRLRRSGLRSRASITARIIQQMVSASIVAIIPGANPIPE